MTVMVIDNKLIVDLAAYLQKQEEKKGIIQLRNLTRSRGVGFFGANYFYPDFMLLIIEEGK